MNKEKIHYYGNKYLDYLDQFHPQYESSVKEKVIKKMRAGGGQR